MTSQLTPANTSTIAQEATSSGNINASVTIAGSSDFSRALLEALVAAGKLPPSAINSTNIAALNAWQAAEGQWGATGEWNPSSNHNPLNTTEPTNATAHHGTDSISIYPDWTTGVASTVKTLEYPRYTGVLSVLAANAGVAALSAAVVQSGWGTAPFANASTADQAGQGAPQTANLTSISGDISGAISGAENLLSGGLLGGGGIFGSILSFLGVPSFGRLAMGAAGIALMIGGVAIFLATTEPGQKAIETGSELAPLVAA